ncbi:MAG: phosphotransferase [Deltaproteobacteria bacterium]|jgi:aminoglycoside phosphotransferase (APT) family kinase protein|nr:phosphotransferase [Deltaproteobacteria bacterium]
MKAGPEVPRKEIEALFDRYCHSIDNRRLDGLSEVFTTDCRVSYGDQRVVGYDALVAHLRAGLVPFAETRHRVSEIELEIEPGGVLHGRARVVAWHRFEKNRPDLTLHGRYRCLLARTERGWRIAELVGSEERRERGAPSAKVWPRVRTAARAAAAPGGGGMRQPEHGPGLDVSGPEWQSLADFLHRELHPHAARLHILRAERASGGASWETIFVRFEVEGGASDGLRRVAIRRAPTTGPMPPYDVRKDVTIFQALAKSDVPVPRVLAWSEDPNVFLRPFTVTPFIEGESHDLSQVERWPVWQEDREALGQEIVHTLAALQRFDWQSTTVAEVLGERGSASERLDSTIRRYLDPLSEIIESRDLGIPVLREIAAWLRRHAPSNPENELVISHGDFRFGNFIWQGKQIAAVLDWERAMLGPRMMDLGFLCMPLSRRKEPTIMGKALALEALAESYLAATGHAFDLREVQYFAVFWQFLEGVNTTRALLQDPMPMIASGVLVQPNLVERQTLRLIEDYEAGRDVI